MSWSMSTPKVVKSQIEEEIDRAMPGVLCEEPVLDQIACVRRAAKEIARSIPGPLMIVNMSGHANGVGWQKKEGYANDCISVTVTQFVE